jgi:hypothetical protein
VHAAKQLLNLAKSPPLNIKSESPLLLAHQATNKRFDVQCLPEGWDVHKSKKKKIPYFSNQFFENTMSSKHEIPRQSEAMSKRIKHNLDVKKKSAKIFFAIPDGWEMYVDRGTNRLYFFNAVAGIAKFEIPE